MSHIKRHTELYINGQYVCSSTRYKTCKEFAEKVKKEFFINWQGLKGNIIKVKPTDSVKVKWGAV